MHRLQEQSPDQFRVSVDHLTLLCSHYPPIVKWPRRGREQVNIESIEDHDERGCGILARGTTGNTVVLSHDP